MKIFKSLFTCALLACATTFVTGYASEQSSAAEGFNVLVFSRTKGFRHAEGNGEAINTGVPFLNKLGTSLNFKVDASEDADLFTPEKLKKYQAVILLNTTGEFLEQGSKEATQARQAAFEGYVKNGGAVVGIHAATDAGRHWPEYTKIIGGLFQHHPHHQTCTIDIVDKQHPSVKHLIVKGEKWVAYDEWYNFIKLQKDNHVILSVDDSTCKGSKPCLYEGGEKVGSHPFAWTRNYGKGKIFYTSRGHYGKAFTEIDFVQHVVDGLYWTLGSAAPAVNPEILPKEVKPTPKKKK